MINSDKPGRSVNVCLGGFSVLELLVALGIVAVLAVFSAAWLQSMRSKALTVGCTSVLRQLHSGFAMYGVDHRGALPPLLTNATSDEPIISWAQRISPYTVGRATFYGRIPDWAMCPEHVKTTASELFGNYGMIEKVVTKGRMIGLTNGAEVPLLFDAGGYVLSDLRRYSGKAAYWYIPGNPANASGTFYNADFTKDARTGRHGGNLNILFMDGHVISVPSEEFVRDDRFWVNPLQN